MSARFIACLLFAGFTLAVIAPVEAGSSNSLLDISSDGKLLACSNRDSGTVTIVDRTTLRKLREVTVGKFPEGVTFVGESHQLAVAVYAEDKLVLLDADSGEIQNQIELFDEPYAVVSDKAGQRLFVTLDYPGRLVEIHVGTQKVVREIPAGKFTRGLALSSQETQAYVVEYYTGTVVAIDLASGNTVDRWEGISNDNLARQVVAHPTRNKLYLPHIRSRVTAVHGEGSIFPYVSVIDTQPLPAGSKAKRRRRIPMDAFLGALVTANPWECAISPDGKQFFVVFAGTDDMFACRVVDDDYREIEYRQYLQIGKNPRAVRVSPDSAEFYVYNALDFNVVAYDTKSLSKVGEVTVTAYPKSSELLRGKILFYSALNPMASRRWISCSSCHPDGDPDGRTWHNPEGLRNTQSLAGMAWTHPIHWSADRDEVQDFEHTIRGKLMQGRGLLLGKLNPELGPPNRGLSRDLDALAAYSNSHVHTLSPHAKQGLSPAAKRGQSLFFSKETRCAECHTGPHYSDSQPGGKSLMHNVGTGSDDPTEKMGPKYDTPTLLGLYRTPPYLHHGKAETLRDVLTTQNLHDLHGRTSQLSGEQVTDLVEFLLALPYEDSEAASHAAGLKKVDK